jgi:hypothetical protein
MISEQTSSVLIMNQADFTDQHLSSQTPILITDALVNWPAMAKWSPLAFSSIASNPKVNLQVSRSGIFRYNPDGSARDKSNQLIISNMSFREAAKSIGEGSGDPKYYISQQDLFGKLPELVPDICFPETREPSEVNLWFGSGGTVTPLHFDHQNNLFAQVYGTKTFRLYSPEDTACLYPYSKGTKMSHLSQLELDHPIDAGAFPLYERAHSHTVRIDAGQLLFLPAFWWHHVISETISISVNKWWGPELGQCRGANGLDFLRAEYQADNWTKIRQRLQISRQTLITSAEASLSNNLSASVLAISVAMNEFESDLSDTHDHFELNQSKRKLASAVADVLNGNDAAGDVLPVLMHLLKHFKAACENTATNSSRAIA